MLDYVTLLNKTAKWSDYLEENELSLLDVTFIMPNDFAFNIFRVTEDYIARPDLISYDAYGDSMYADVICKLNGISNPFELNMGMLLIVPAPGDITKFHIRPDADDIAADEDNFNAPVAKLKTNKKRKPNEAVVGSSRFKIDQSSGVVIY